MVHALSPVLASFPFAYLKLLELCLLRSNETSFPPLVLMMSVLCEAFARFLHSMDLLCEVLEPDMLTVGAPLSREVGDSFLTRLGNFSRRWLPKVLSHTVAVWCVSKRILRRY